jgi:hypothetical protein
VNNINKGLNQPLANIVVTSETASEKGSPEYMFTNMNPSPEFIPASQTPTESPIVFPETPEGSVPEPTSPDITPPPTNPLDILTEKAQQYSSGDQVFLRGDLLSSRIWRVSKVGDRMLTIETANLENLPPGDNIKVVTADDIIPYDPNLINNPAAQPIEQVGGYAGTPVPSPGPMMYGGGMMPAINFAPQFKIMNGGSDFSTDPTTANPSETINAATLPDINNLSLPSPSTPQSGGAQVEAKVAEEPSSFRDCSKLLIQKLG